MTKSNKVQAVAMAAMVATMVIGFAASAEAQVSRKRDQYVFDAGSSVARKRTQLVMDAEGNALARRRTQYVADASHLVSIKRWWIMKARLGR